MNNASVTVHFAGTYLTWITQKGPACGRAKVTLDHRAPVIVDFCSVSSLWQQKVWETGNLAWGAHTLKIEWTDSKRHAVRGTCIGVNAFDVVGSLN